MFRGTIFVSASLPKQSKAYCKERPRKRNVIILFFHQTITRSYVRIKSFIPMYFPNMSEIVTINHLLVIHGFAFSLFSLKYLCR